LLFSKFPAIFLGEKTISDDKRTQVYEAFGFMETFLEGRKWFCGEKLTIADLSVLASLSSIIVSLSFAFMVLTREIILILFFQQIGAKLDDYPNLKRWFGQCAANVKGYEENDEGAKRFGDLVKSRLDDKF
jgi:glutathione S-transferase